MKIIIDTNIIFSFLLKEESEFRKFIFFSNDINFYTCRYSIIELFKLKDKLLKYSKLSEDKLLNSLYKLLKVIELYNEDLISEKSLKIAYELCKEIDEKDTIFVALTLELNGLLWTGDKKLINHLKSKNFNKFFNLRGGK